MRWLLFCVSLMCMTGITLSAQPPETAASTTKYLVRLRYKIDAELQQRYAYYKQMLASIEQAGFKAAPGLPRAELFGEMLSGTIPASGISTLRLERFLRVAVLIPEGYQLPADAQQTVLVRLILNITGSDRQRELYQLAREQLKPLGFIENEGANHQQHTRMLGRLPVAAFDALLNSNLEVTLPTSLKAASAVAGKTPLVRLAIVIAETSPPVPDVAQPTAAPAGKEYLDKISPDLKGYLTKVPEGDLDKFMHLELVLRSPQLDNDFRLQLLRSETMFITEGNLGPIVTGLAPPSRITELAKQDNISTVRLPQIARPFPASQLGAVEFAAIGQELGTLPVAHIPATLPKPAKRAVIIGDDFRQFEKWIGEGFPKNTRLIDATAELNPDLKPASLPEGDASGQSTLLAKEFLKQNPHDEVVLVRIDAGSPFQLQQLGESVLGKPWLTPALLNRKEEWAEETTRIENEKLELRVMRSRILNDFTLDDATKAKRLEYQKRQEALDALDKAHFQRGIRFEQFIHDMASLKGAKTVCVTMQWTDGYADLPGQSPRLRFLTHDVLRGAKWYQATLNRPGQVWTGLFRDNNGDQVMEFTASKSAARHDFAQLAWKPFGAASSAVTTLPENTVVQVTLNWFEVHAATGDSGDIYRKPQADFSIKVLKERDGAGKQLPADAYEVIARSPVLADRVEHSKRGSLYQSILRFTVPAGGGKYALQLTGKAPDTTGDQLSTEQAEIHPKISLEVVDPLKRNTGRVIFSNLATVE